MKWSTTSAYIQDVLERPGILPQQREVLKRFDTEQDKNEGLSITTRKGQIIVLFNFAKAVQKPFKDMQREDIEQYLYSLKILPVSLDFHKIIIRKFFKWVYQSDSYPDVVKWIKLKRQRTRKLPEDMLTLQEVRALVDAADNPRDRALVSILYESGCRLSEVTNILQKDVKIDQYGAIIVVNGKTGMRRIRLIDSAPDLTLWLNNHPLKGDNNPLFNDRRFRLQSLGQDGVQKVLQALTKRAGITKHVHPHLLRHTRLTALAKDFTESELKIMAGWSGDSRMAGIYVHLSGADIERKQLERAGLIGRDERQKEENLLKPHDCPRCKEVNPATAKFCYKCGMALDLKTAVEMEDVEKGLDKSLSTMLNSKIEELIERRATEIVNEKLKELASKRA